MHNTLKQIGGAIESWWHWNYEAIIIIAIVVVCVVGIPATAYSIAAHSCKTYGVVTERATKLVSGECYVQTTRGWRSRGTTVEVRD